MRGGHLQPTRPDYYDRAAVGQAANYSADSVAPAALTTRWTYTVPANKKAYLEAVVALLMRTAVAAPAGRARCLVTYTPNGGVGQQVIRATILTNTVGDRDHAELGLCGFMSAGDAISGQTEDGSTNGTVDYLVAAKTQQFDA